MTNKKIMFTGGGTAGHVMVNLALIPFFKQAGWEIDYIGSETGIERQLIGELDHVTYHPIATGKLRRYLSIENVKDPFKVIKGIFQAWRIIGKRQPDVLFSKGGFVSVPVVFAAKLRRIPTLIHESDYTPGLANKLAIPLAQTVLTTFPETSAYVPEKKTTYVGAVIREELFQGSRSAGFAFTGLTTTKPILLIMGGSGGSRKINDVVRATLTDLLKEYQVIHICGRGNKDTSLQMPGYIQYEYVNEELKDVFAITDYVLSRAGANAIFEFLALRLPMLLIPLSLESSRGDQIDNAASFAQSGYAHVLQEEALTQETLYRELIALKKSHATLVEQMQAYESDNARDQVIQLITEAAK